VLIEDAVDLTGEKSNNSVYNAASLAHYSVAKAEEGGYQVTIKPIWGSQG